MAKSDSIKLNRNINLEKAIWMSVWHWVLFDFIISAGAWIAGELNDLQFIEIDLGSIQPVYGVVTKGRSGHLEWVKAYKVLYSRDGTVYTYIKDAEAPNEIKVKMLINKIIP